MGEGCNGDELASGSGIMNIITGGILRPKRWGEEDGKWVEGEQRMG